MTNEETRRVELLGHAQEILLVCIEKNFPLIQADFIENREEYEEIFADNIKEVILGWKERYQGDLKSLKYLVISSLESSTVTKTYEFQIAAYDENIYADANPVSTYWVPSFVYRFIEEDMEYLRERICQEMIQVKEDEIYEVRRRHVLNYLFISICVINGMVSQITDRDIWQEMGCGDIDILYGAYMEQAAKIGSINGREQG